MIGACVIRELQDSYLRIAQVLLDELVFTFVDLGSVSLNGKRGVLRFLP